jgi:hypothetical protein
MAGTTALQLYSYPTTTDQASPAGIQTLAQAVEKQVVAVFPDTSTRDSRWSTATGLTNGALCFVTSTGELQLRSAGAWVVIGGRAAPFAEASGSTTWSVTSGGGGVTNSITYPTSRFSQAPITVAMVNSSAGNAVAATLLIFNNTNTGCSLQIAPGSGSWGATGTITGYWQAVQATSASASG